MSQLGPIHLTWSALESIQLCSSPLSLIDLDCFNYSDRDSQGVCYGKLFFGQVSKTTTEVFLKLKTVLIITDIFPLLLGA